MRYLIIAALLITGCSSPYTPIIERTDGFVSTLKHFNCQGARLAFADVQRYELSAAGNKTRFTFGDFKKADRDGDGVLFGDEVTTLFEDAEVYGYWVESPCK